MTLDGHSTAKDRHPITKVSHPTAKDEATP